MGSQRRHRGFPRYLTAVASSYSPSLTGRLAANGHPTAGASLSQCEKGRRARDKSGNPPNTLPPLCRGTRPTHCLPMSDWHQVPTSLACGVRSFESYSSTLQGLGLFLLGLYSTQLRSAQMYAPTLI